MLRTKWFTSHKLSSRLHDFFLFFFFPTQDFKKYGPKTAAPGSVCELEEDAAHLFLEKRNETLTVRELRDGE